ncbi:alcohol dehydrogenase, partial [Burkholderia sp. H160]
GIMTGVADQGFAPAFFGRFVQFHHIHVGSRDSFEAMNLAISYHGVKPVISRFFGFGEARSAYNSMKDSDHFGKVVIRHD